MTIEVKEFNAKVQESIKNTGEFNAWEGAVRSGKTFASLIAWSMYIIKSPESIFLMSGATMGSISRNCLIGDFGLISITGAVQRTDTDGSKYLDWCGNKIYYVGSDNKRSYAKIRGMTIGGWYADELNLHDPDFIIEALNRSIASKDRKNFWTLNPSPPNHFIYTQYIDVYCSDPDIDMHYHHFVMSDNPAISEKARKKFETQYKASGLIYYQRFILGLRVNAEGRIYTEFSKAKHVKELPANTKVLYANIGSDIGGTGSATSYVCVLYYINANKKLAIHAVSELYDKDNYSTESILNNFKTFSINMKKLYIVADAYSDSAEQLIKKSMDEQGIVNVGNSKKCQIVDRIRLVKYLLAMGRLTISPNCPHLIDAIETSLWNSKATKNKDERLDDGTNDQDSLDAFEYAIERDMTDLMEA
jgi:PBSX family phage terminase large subunit